MKVTADIIRQKATEPDPEMLKKLQEYTDRNLLANAEFLSEGHVLQIVFVDIKTNERTVREVAYQLAANGFFVEQVKPETPETYASIKIKLERK